MKFSIAKTTDPVIVSGAYLGALGTPGSLKGRQKRRKRKVKEEREKRKRGKEREKERRGQKREEIER